MPARSAPVTVQTTHDDADLVAATAPLLFTVARAAAMLSISRTTLYELLAAGTIESIHIGRSRRVPVGALHDFIASQRRDSSVQYR